MAENNRHDAIPGTVTLVDLQNVIATRHSGNNSDIVLVPAPSDDPDDPLNWSPARKALSTVCLSVPYCSSKGEWLARCILQGFIAAPIEALPEISVADVYFTHERGTYMAIYAFSLIGSNYFAPVICGFIAEYQGWEWVFYYPSIFLGAATVFVFFFMEETNYTRHSVDVSHRAPEATPGKASDSDKEKGEPTTTRTDSSSSVSRTPRVKKSFWRKMSLLNFDSWLPDTLHYRALQSLYFLNWPVIVYAGAIFTGRFSDWLTVRLARRNNGVMEAEHRLWPFLPCIILVPSSLILWGVGAAHEVHWFGLIFAMWLLAFCNACGITLSVNYMVDSYREISGQAITTVMLIRNTMSFAISYGITPWIENLGYQNCFVSAAFIGMACSAVFLVMVKFGKPLRARSREKYWKLVEENVKNGINH
ncbi:hypothetical protein ATERTT37_004468 [Aspergillus terreus]